MPSLVIHELMLGEIFLTAIGFPETLAGGEASGGDDVGHIRRSHRREACGNVGITHATRRTS
jgi:hypothetical protein